MGVDAGALSARETTEIDVDASWPRAYCLRICMCMSRASSGGYKTPAFEISRRPRAR